MTYEEVLKLSEAKFFTHPIGAGSGIDSIDGFWINRQDVWENPILSTAVHTHNYYEIELLCNGTATHICNGKSRECGRGYISLLKNNDYHTWHIPHGKAIDIFTVNFSDSNLSYAMVGKISQATGTVHFDLSEEDLNRIEPVFNYLLQEFKEAKEDFQIVARSLMNVIVSFVLNRYVADSDEVENKNPVMKRAMAHIEKNFLNPNITVQSVSDQLKITPNYFGTIFKKATGSSFSKYIKERRLHYSLQLLSDDMFTIGEIAEMSGFNNAAYYISQFKSHYGMTPKQYVLYKTGKPGGKLDE